LFVQTIHFFLVIDYTEFRFFIPQASGFLIENYAMEPGTVLSIALAVQILFGGVTIVRRVRAAYAYLEKEK